MTPTQQPSSGTVTTQVEFPQYAGNAHLVFANPGEYNGTYLTMLLVLIDNLLGDGPLDVAVIHESGVSGYEQTSGHLISSDGQVITFADGHSVYLPNVVSFSVTVTPA